MDQVQAKSVRIGRGCIADLGATRLHPGSVPGERGTQIEGHFARAGIWAPGDRGTLGR